MIDWTNPYSLAGDLWLKGNLHTHSAPESPCGRVSLDRVLRLYEQAEFDFLSLSNHLIYSPVTIPTELLIIPGLEWNSRNGSQDRLEVNFQEHLGIYSLDTELLTSSVAHAGQSQVLNALAGKEALVIANHPNWLVPPHYSEEDLFRLYRYIDGIEVYNAVIDRHPGSADATLQWDRLLTDKGPILGFASDDSHLEGDIGKSYIMVNVNGVSVEAVLSSIVAGRFYCSSGVEILRIGRDQDEVYCVAEGEITIDIIGENGQLFASSQGEIRIQLDDIPSAYVRFALYGANKQQAWSQPFFRTAQDSLL